MLRRISEMTAVTGPGYPSAAVTLAARRDWVARFSFPVRSPPTDRGRSWRLPPPKARLPWLHLLWLNTIPASGAPYVPRTVAPQVLRGTPHSLTVLVRDDGEPMEPCAEGGRGALERYRQISAGLSGTGGMEGVAVLRNSLPVWNEGMAAFTLPFYSRAQACTCIHVSLPVTACAIACDYMHMMTTSTLPVCSRAQLPSKKNFHIARQQGQ